MTVGTSIPREMERTERIAFDIPQTGVFPEGVSMVGDWMGSSYGLGGQRWDMCLFLDHDGRYERTERSEPSYERKEGGRWEYDEAERLLRLIPDTPADESGRSSDRWWVMSIESFESNLVLVLRAAMLASRNLPIMLYRVHGNDRAYGTGWQKRLA